MKVRNSQKWAAAVACLAMVFSPVAMAAQPTAQPSDISLQAGGTLVGQVVDAQGVAIAKSPVSVLRNGKEVARTETDQTGKFTVSGLKGGVYEVATTEQRGVYRFWAPRTAPPAARKGLLISSTADVVRGQQCATGQCDPCGGGNPFQVVGDWIGRHPIMTAGIVAAAIAIPVAIDDDDDPTS